MSLQTVGEDALKSVRPLDLVAYLRASGWTAMGNDESEPATLWEKADIGRVFEVLAPRHTEWRDYSRRISEALNVLAHTEKRSELSIIRDVQEVSADVVRLRAIGADSGEHTIRLDDGARLIGSLRGSLFAAACSVVRPKRAYHSRKPAPAARYIEQVQLGQSEPGSYVLTVVSPVSPQLGAGQRQTADVSDPYPRRVTRMWAAALTQVLRAAERSAATGNFDGFEQGTESGVSADLCESLASVRDCEQVTKVELGVSWASSRPAPELRTGSIVLTRDILDILREAGRILREHAPIEDFELLGPVIELSNQSERHGTATVLTNVEFQPRKVTMELSGEGWDRAYAALNDRNRLLSCIGQLEKTGRQYALVSPREVELTDVDALNV